MSPAPRAKAGLPAATPSSPPVSGAKEPTLGRRAWELLRQMATVNLGLKALSLILAVTVYLLVNTDRDREITLHIGTSFTLPEDKVLVSERLPEVRVTVRGPSRRLRRLDEQKLDRVHFDLSRVSGGEVPVTPDLVRVPSGITVVDVSPRSLRVAFEKRLDKAVPVAVATQGRPLHGFVVGAVTARPATVTARGPQGAIAALSAIRGGEVRVDGRSDSFEHEVELLPPEGVELTEGRRAVVRVEIKEELVSQRLGLLPVKVRGDGIDAGRFALRPAQVDVTLTGALLAVERAIAAGVHLEVRLAPAAANPGAELTVTVESPVPGVGVTLAPARVRLQRK